MATQHRNTDVEFLVGRLCLAVMGFFLMAASVEQRVRETAPRFNAELAPLLRAAGIANLPKYVVLVYLKDHQFLELFVGMHTNKLKIIKSYPVLAASGEWGPKLREGDMQVPEGIYPIEFLNPNSAFHLSMKVGYPNRIDRAQAARENRSNLGGNIMIHGGAASIGCIAIGDPAIEELFHLAARTDLRNWRLISSPVDLRFTDFPPEVVVPWPWMKAVYASIREELWRGRVVVQKVDDRTPSSDNSDIPVFGVTTAE